MADVTINSGLEQSHYLAGKKSGIFWTSSSNGYVFFITNTANSAGPLKYSKTTDGGQTWGAAVTVRSTNCSRFAVHYDKETNGDTGTKLHVLIGDWDDNQLYYRSLDTASDTLGTAVAIATTSSVYDLSQFFPDHQHCTITKTRGGNLLAGYRNNSNVYFYRSTDGGATWGSRNTGVYESDTEDLFWLIPAGDTDTNDAAAIYLDDSGNQLSFKLYDDSANTWGTETAIGSLMAGDWPDVYWGFDVAVRHTDNKAIIAWWNDENTATADLNVSVLTLTAAGANSTALTAIATNLSAAGECCVMINGNNDDIYVAWIAGGTWDSLTDIDHTVSTDDGSTWATPTQFSVTQDDLRQVHSMSIIASGQTGRWMPVWENDDLNYLITNYDNSVAISAGGTNFTSSLAGAFSATAVITKKGLKPLAGAHSMAATVAKKAITSKSGGVGAITGVATKKAIKSFSGAISPLSATVTWLPIKYLTGSISSSATIVKATAKKLSGISGSIAATTSKKTLKPLTGIAGGLSATITPVKVAILSLAGTMGALSGGIVKRVLKPLAGPVSVSGDIIKSTLKALSGVTALAGTIVKKAAKALSGATGGLTAALTGAKLVAIALAGATGSLSAIVTKSTLRPLGGTITSAGEMVRKTIKSITGAAGALTAVLTPELVGGLYQVVGGAITASGTVVKLTKTTLSGAYSMAAELYKGMVAAFSGNFSATGEISKRITVVRTGVMGAVSGTVARATTFVLIASGSIATLTSSIQRRINKSLSGAITNIFAFAGKPYKLAFSGAFTLSGFIQFNSVTRRAKMKAGLVVKSVTSMIAGRAKR